MLDHREFREAHAAGRIDVRVDRARAGELFTDPSILPEPVRKRQALLRFSGFAVFLVGLVALVVLPWYAGAAIILAGIAIIRIGPADAAKGVLDAALADETVYREAVERGALSITPRD